MDRDRALHQRALWQVATLKRFICLVPCSPGPPARRGPTVARVSSAPSRALSPTKEIVRSNAVFAHALSGSSGLRFLPAFSRLFPPWRRRTCGVRSANLPRTIRPNRHLPITSEAFTRRGTLAAKAESQGRRGQCWGMRRKGLPRLRVVESSATGSGTSGGAGKGEIALGKWEMSQLSALTPG
jgi:hypothetical protein